MSDASQFVDVGGCQLHYKTAGTPDAPALVMIHAGVADLTQWDPQLATFSPQYHLIRYDTRGWGQSITEDVPFSNRDDLRKLLDHLGIEKAIVMGCSRSGQIALDFTLEYPERVRGLIWVCGGISGWEGPASSPEEEALIAEMTAAEEANDLPGVARLDVRFWAVGPTRDPTTVNEDLKEWMYTTCLRNYTTHTHYGQPIGLNPPAVNRLSEIQVPTLVIIGVFDENATRVAADYLAHHVTGAVKHEMADTAHIPNREHPDEFNAIVGLFLTKAGL
jgi:pimeloyl-ACP methyl ester carboxylesterase